MNAYVLIAATGEHDDYRTTPVAVCLDKEKLEALQAKLEAENKRHGEVIELLRGFTREWEAANPIEHERSIDVPRWRPGLGKEQITPKMREERERAIKINEAISNRNMLAYTEHMKTCDIAKRVFLAEHAPDVDAETYVVNCYFTDFPTDYYIEEVPFIQEQ